MTKKSRLFDNKRLEITINRLCQELIENHKNFSDTVLVGLQPRGIYFLNRIKKNLDSILNKEIQIGYLDTTFYRDDFRSKEVPKAKETLMPFLVDDKNVVIIELTELDNFDILESIYILFMYYFFLFFAIITHGYYRYTDINRTRSKLFSPFNFKKMQ